MRNHSGQLQGLPVGIADLAMRDKQVKVFDVSGFDVSRDWDNGVGNGSVVSGLQEDVNIERKTPSVKLLVTVPEAGRVLALSRSKIYELMDAGYLPSVCIGRSRRIRMRDLEKFVES